MRFIQTTTISKQCLSISCKAEGRYKLLAMSTTPIAAPESEPTPRPSLPLTALLALFRLSLHHLTRWWRLVALTTLFLLPMLLAVIPRVMEEARNRPFGREELFQVELMFAFFLVPHAVVPLACLLFGAGIINDEIEDQTLTYLLLRPIYRWVIYLIKLVCAVLLVWTLVAFFIPPLLWVIWWQQPEAPVAAWDLCQRSGEVIFVLCLAATAYNAVFGLLSLLTRRILVFGIFYIVVLEGVLANVPLVVREFTLMYYLRVLILRGPGSPPADKIWGIDLSMAPEAAGAAATLVVVAGLATVFAAYLFSVREFRLKTPDGG